MAEAQRRGESLASRAIAAWCREHGQGALVAGLRAHGYKCSQATVSTWARGVSTPRVELALALRALLGVPVEAWTEPPEPPARGRAGLRKR